MVFHVPLKYHTPSSPSLPLIKYLLRRYFLETKKFKVAPEGAFASQDKNSDGMVTWEEFDGPKGDEHPSLTSSTSTASSSSEEL